MPGAPCPFGAKGELRACAPARNTPPALERAAHLAPAVSGLWRHRDRLREPSARRCGTVQGAYHVLQGVQAVGCEGWLPAHSAGEDLDRLLLALPRACSVRACTVTGGGHCGITTKLSPPSGRRWTRCFLPAGSLAHAILQWLQPQLPMRRRHRSASPREPASCIRRRHRPASLARVPAAEIETAIQQTKIEVGKRRTKNESNARTFMWNSAPDQPNTSKAQATLRWHLVEPVL